MTRPFPLPSDLPRSDVLRDWSRVVASTLLAKMARNASGSEIASDLYGERVATLVSRAGVSPASLSGWASQLAPNVVGDFLGSLRPYSAALQLFDLGARLDLSGVKTVALPAPGANFPTPVWVEEGAPMPFVASTFGSVQLGPPKKMAYIVGLTGELERSTVAADVIDFSIREATARGLEASLFSNAAASAARPAGLLNGVTPITATAGGGSNAIFKDMQNLIGAITDAGGGSSIYVFGNPRQGIAASTEGQGGDVIWTPSLPAGTIVAVEAAAFVSGFTGLPEIDIAREATIHMESATPLAIGTAGTPNTVAAPAQNLWQSDTLALRAILRCAWAMRAPGMVQMVTGASW